MCCCPLGCRVGHNLAIEKQQQQENNNGLPGGASAKEYLPLPVWEIQETPVPSLDWEGTLE